MTALLPWIGYGALFSMGLILGALGAGGSILTLPILTLLMNISLEKATVYSSIIVGCTAFLGVAKDYKKVSLKGASIFIIPSLIGVGLSRRVFLPSFPEIFLGLTREQCLTMLLCGLMLAAGVLMVRQDHVQKPSGIADFNSIYIGLIGLICGSFLGLLGAGGGFIIVPILTLTMNLNIDRAKPLSLCIITLNSLAVFFSDLSRIHYHDVFLLSQYTSLTMLGLLIGSYSFNQINQIKMQRYFGVVILILAMAILQQEFF